MIERIRNERGIALVTALLLTMMSLVIVAAVLYLLSQQTLVTSASKRYKTALDASHGGLEVYSKDLISQILSGSVSSSQLTASFNTIGLSFGPYSSCMKNKLNNATSKWDVTSGAACGASAKQVNPKQNFDATFKLNGVNGSYNVYAQIVDTVPGNSDPSGAPNLSNGGGVTSITGGGGGGVSLMHIPALYTIEIQGEQANNNLEHAKLSVLYAY